MRSSQFFKASPLLGIYLTILLLGILLLITGYSFSYRFLNTLLLCIIIIYPVVLFFRSPIDRWIKLVTGLLFLIIVIFLANKVLLITSFGHETTLRNTRVWSEAPFSLQLCKRIGWAGPPYEQYELTRYRLRGLLRKRVAVGYPTGEEADPCKIRFTRDHYSNQTLYEFDLCKMTLEE